MEVWEKSGKLVIICPNLGLNCARLIMLHRHHSWIMCQ